MEEGLMEVMTREIILEARWLYGRAQQTSRAPCQEKIPNFPTALQLYGCLPLVGPSATKSTPPPSVSPRKVFYSAGPVCSLGAETETRGDFERRRTQLASLAPPHPEYGDQEDVMLCTPGGSEKEVFTWLSNPATRHSLPISVLLNAKDNETALKLMGGARPLSPVIQPQLPFHVKRNKRKCCRLHQPSSTSTSITPEERAFRAAWDNEEPLSLPPLCSCPNEALVAKYHQWIASGPTEEETEAGACNACAGLLFFPFSLLELPLTQDMPSLLEAVELLPLPPSTHLYCEGPKVSVCIVARSPEHEWEIAKGLIAVNVQTRVSVYDVCSVHFYPGAQLSDLHWSQLNNTSAIVSPSPANRVIRPSGSTPMNPPAQYALNIINAQAPSLSSSVTSFASRALRRPFCLRLRDEIDWKKAAESVGEQELNALVEDHRARLISDAVLQLTSEAKELRKRSAVATMELAGLRQQALASGGDKEAETARKPLAVIEMNSAVPRKNSNRVSEETVSLGNANDTAPSGFSSSRPVKRPTPVSRASTGNHPRHRPMSQQQPPRMF